MPRPRMLFCLFDGLRRDMVRPELMPRLHRFRSSWCEFPNSSAAFPSETRVQVSSLVTGTFPAGHGIMANSFLDPALGLSGPFDTSDIETMARARRIYGRLHKAQTLGECLARAGRRYAVVTTGTRGNAMLLDLHAGELGQPVFSTLSSTVSSPAARHEEITGRFGPPPSRTFPDTAITAYATRVLLQHFIPDHDADLQVIWFNEPDLTFHYRGIGSPESLAALRAVDAAFGRILDWWDGEGRAAGWRLVAASDHGQITVTGQVDVAGALRDGGFRVGPGGDLQIRSGYSSHLVVRDRDPDLAARVVRFLAEQRWCGLIMSRTGIEGTLAMAEIGVENERSADVAFTLRTTDAANDWGYPGTCLADNPDIPPGGGLHGGLHAIELNTLLVFGGDGLVPSGRIDTPAGVIDIAPTMLHILGVPVPPTATGRVLHEALTGGRAAPAWREDIVHARTGAHVQQLTVARIEGQEAPRLRGARRLA